MVKIIEMGGSHDDVRRVLGIDITDERIDDFVKWDKEDKAKKEGGRINKESGGMMSVLPRGTEMDYRGGGMIPMGSFLHLYNPFLLLALLN